MATDPLPAIPFRTGWFLESVVSASFIVLVIRSRRPFFKSRPSRYLLTATFLVVVVTLLLPYTPIGEILGFTQLPLLFPLVIGFIIVLDVFAAELTKRIFYKMVQI